MRECNVYTLNENEKITREELKFATKFMLSLITSRKVHNKLNIWVESKDIRHKEKMDGTAGVRGDHTKSPRNFNVVLNSLCSRNRQLLTLAHELVHVKQFAINQLGLSWTSDGVNFTRWKRRDVNTDKVHYWDLPWEVEALGRQEGLLHRYKKFVKEQGIKFP